MERRDKKIVRLEEGWSFVATGLSKIRRGSEGLSSEEYMQAFTLDRILRICVVILASLNCMLVVLTMGCA